MQNALKSNEWLWNWLVRTSKIEIQKMGQNNSDFLQNWFHPEIRSPLFNLQKFEDSEKSTPKSCRIHWNLMYDKEFGYLQLLKWKYRRMDRIIQTFYKIGCPQKLDPTSLMCRNFESLRKVLLNHLEWNLKMQNSKLWFFQEREELLKWNKKHFF